MFICRVISIWLAVAYNSVSTTTWLESMGKSGTTSNTKDSYSQGRKQKRAEIVDEEIMEERNRHGNVTYMTKKVKNTSRVSTTSGASSSKKIVLEIKDLKHWRTSLSPEIDIKASGKGRRHQKVCA
jgi:hypothetical protein